MLLTLSKCEVHYCYRKVLVYLAQRVHDKNFHFVSWVFSSSCCFSMLQWCISSSDTLYKKLLVRILFYIEIIMFLLLNT